MDLILWRHAEADDEPEDLERALTGKGLRQAAAMAEWLRPRLPEQYRVLASQAVRSQQTAQALTGSVRILPALNPGADYAAILSVAGWPERRDLTIIVGHQPTLGQVAAFLLCGEPQPWSIKKGAIWWLSNRNREDRAQVILRAMQAPQLL